MAEMTVKEAVQEQLVPMNKLMHEFKHKIEIKFEHAMEDKNKRITFLEQAILGKEGPDNRFEKLIQD